MGTESRKSEDQTLPPQMSVGNSIGPGQLVVTNPEIDQERASPIQLEQHDEPEIEADSVAEPTAEIRTTEEAPMNNKEEKVEIFFETTNEPKDSGEVMDDPGTGLEPNQGLSQNKDQITEEQSTVIVNPLDDYLVEEEVNLTPRQAKALAALLTTNSIVEAARISETPERTLRRWITTPEFKAALKEVIQSIKQVYLIETVSQYGLAMQARRDLLENPNQPGAAIKEKIADKIIISFEKALEMSTIEERVERLERLVG